MSTHDLANGTKRSAPPAPLDDNPRGFDVPHKPIDNQARPKATYASDDECARLLGAALRELPGALPTDRASAFPLLDAVLALDAARATGVGREIVFIAAMTHRIADERRTAEYLLRHRQAVVEGHRSPMALLLAARCAAEMDVRRARDWHSSLPRSLAAAPEQRGTEARRDDRSAGDMVLAALRVAVGTTAVTPILTDYLVDGVTIALEVAERHVLHGGRGSAIIGMRTDARKSARLVTHLRDAWQNDVVARNLARLLTGADGAPIEAALLWWSVRPDLTSDQIPDVTRARWMRYLRATTAAWGDAPAYPQPLEVDLDEDRTAHYKPGIADEPRSAVNRAQGPSLVAGGRYGRHEVVDQVAQSSRPETVPNRAAS